MSYLQAVEHAAKEKEKVADTQGTIDTLWKEKKAIFVNGYGEKFEVFLTQTERHLDILLSRKNEPIGFITLKTEKHDTYSIVNDSKVNPHPTISHTPGHGLAVKEEFRKHGLGSALLSLGIGIAQKDHKEKASSTKFEVLATDVTESGFGCYKNFGFQLKEGMKVTEGSYTNKEHVPEIRILRSKASFWGRLKNRLGL